MAKLTKGGASPAMMREAKKIAKMANSIAKQMKGIGNTAKASGASAGKKPKNVKMKDMMARGVGHKSFKKGSKKK